MRGEPFDATTSLAPLKRFQRRTVDYVFDRLHGPDPVRHFLVADEVGLGKTMIARGIVAKTIEKLWPTAKRIDILYICSNQAIATQNLNRLNVLGKEAMALPTRITLMPLRMRSKDKEDTIARNGVNFVSLTPDTTFNLHSTTGVMEERAFLFRLLEPFSRFTPLKNALQVGASVDKWKGEVDRMSLDGIDKTIIRRFRSIVSKNKALLADLDAVCKLFARRRPKYPNETLWARNALVGKLRKVLSQACIVALKPDLIILDEFQRFRELLSGEGDAGELARALFEYGDQESGARTLLLSATPYKMLTLSEDASDDGDHYDDFLKTVGFLHGHDRAAAVAAELDIEMRQFRRFLQQFPEGTKRAKQARAGIERRLKRVMTRTERVDSTSDRDSMLTELVMQAKIAPIDLNHAAIAAEVARVAGAPDIIEYWKSAPYLLNFMRDYALKKLLKKAVEEFDPALVAAVAKAEVHSLKPEVIDKYQSIDPGNARLRALMSDLFDDGLDQQLWIAPSLPYYGSAPSGRASTKALVFSAWQMVPDALAALISYEVERRMGAAAMNLDYSSATKRRPLQFSVENGRPTALRSVNLIYPSPLLAEAGDPLHIFAASPERLSFEEMRQAVRGSISSKLVGHSRSEAGDSSATRDWEWSAAACVDAVTGNRALEWLQGNAFAWTRNEAGFRDHVAELRRATEAPPAPLHDAAIELLVDLALGSPAVCAVRALRRIAPELAFDDPVLLEAAAHVAWAFRTLFNQHEAVALLRQESEEHYWRSVLAHCAAHNLQAVLDEYAHYLLEGEGLLGAAPGDRASRVAQAMVNALSIRPSQIEADDISVENGRIVFRDPIKMRGRFAMRLAEVKDDEGGSVRLSTVREAFNSPFRPFVLATTSIGQEGLDFHPYCHRVYHWNLPGNPVDLEQREGRVHRFKGHAVRLNVAAAHADDLRRSRKPIEDPWVTMFAAARRATKSQDELIPYWIYEGPMKVERRVPMLPFSREEKRLEWLKRSLTVYRLAFGQPRQDDLLAHLVRLVGEGVDASAFDDLQIRLRP
ncbi:DEAD/DEAH box helicase [Mesorhizobium loti]|uniref:DEAD/DEAH box helicase n=1 Tax=Mesorhizobium jarvisii TaxID=1777867 RepID=A0A6M7TKM4_9HYPH|nr:MULTISPECIES: helicase-related protein [Mesorhizobium]OBQ64323.1 DEAD/DEAH box helicase [Mesorhizobium loti]QKC64473.1 DEAD/DEAH box helicase [Mesorhizobium jarvisii]QKD10387.1 DEAD/DEAH box helicase [Mesorhizobium loti]RJT37028.1 DEAD/DEAH box helicase [Mesorhizobium jarvisii]